MAIIRELVTVLRYQLDRSGLKDYLQAASATAREAAQTAKLFANEVKLGAQDAIEEWRNMPPEVKKAEHEQQKLNQAAREHGKEVKGTAGGYNALASSIRRIVGSYIGIRGAIGFARAGEDLALIHARLKNATSSAEEFEMVDKRLAASARETHTPFAENAEMFLRTKDMLDALGYSASDTLDVVDAVNLTLDASGSKGQSAASFIAQFSKSLSQGKLDGLAFQNMAGNNVRMIRALVDGINEVNPALGATVTNFQELVKQGKITTDLMIPALRTQIDKLSKEVVDMPVSMSDAMNVLRDSLARASLQIERQTGIVRRLAKAIELAADNLKEILHLLFLAGSSFAFIRMRTAIAGVLGGLKASAAAAGGLFALLRRTLWPLVRMMAIFEAIRLVVQDVYYWYKGYSSALGDVIGDSSEWRKQLDWIKGLMNGIKNALGGAGKTLGEWVSGWGTIGILAYGFLRILRLIGRPILTIGGFLLRWMVLPILTAIAAVVGWPATIAIALAAILAGVYSTFDSIKEYVDKVIDSITGYFTNKWDAALDWVSKKLKSVLPDGWVLSQEDGSSLREDLGKQLNPYANRMGALQQPQSYRGGDQSISQQITINAPSNNPAGLARIAGDEVGRATRRVTDSYFAPPAVEVSA